MAMAPPPINHHGYILAVGLLVVVSVSTVFTSPFPLVCIKTIECQADMSREATPKPSYCKICMEMVYNSSFFLYAFFLYPAPSLRLVTKDKLV